MLPSPDILNDFEHGKYVLSNLAAKRAKQLSEGAQPLVRVDSHHPLTIALAEIAAGKIKAILSDDADALEDGVEISLITDETLPAELGILLPALDETEVPLLEAEEIDEHLDADVEVSLSDLVADEDDLVAAPAEEETLSLSDIAEQESLDEEPEE